MLISVANMHLSARVTLLVIFLSGFKCDSDVLLGGDVDISQVQPYNEIEQAITQNPLSQSDWDYWSHGANITQKAYGADRVNFYLYPDASSPDRYDEMVTGDINSVASYDGGKSPIFIIHGYMQNALEKYPQYTKNGTSANVIMVDWKGRAQPKYGLIFNLLNGYNEAVASVDILSSQICDFISFLMTSGKLADPSYVHLIGFSVGGQIAGVTGFKILQATGRKVGRITALDPVGLQYHLQKDLTQKLDKSDADFLSVIHTGIATYGYTTSIGHVDFYPNGGGPIQPGCNLPVDFKRDLPGLPGSCGHSRAWDFFIQSIYKQSLMACGVRYYLDYKQKCPNKTVFGEHVPLDTKGDYYLQIKPAFDSP